MNTQGYTTSIEVNASPERVFSAINNVSGWWFGEIEGETNKLGAEFIYRYKDFHYSKQKITEFVPGKKVVWQVIDAKLSKFSERPEEWVGTEIIFEIQEQGSKTKLQFQHAGLIPSFDCYQACSNAWGALVGKNLKQLIETGQQQGSPF